mmetsp:Transcript_14870/g.36959  ORF Transcript_14870/g.36959 Transcript_14870/m.36959 type:complete len:265 (+) Transcript_14870:485-1279(+)
MVVVLVHATHEEIARTPMHADKGPLTLTLHERGLRPRPRLEYRRVADAKGPLQPRCRLEEEVGHEDVARDVQRGPGLATLVTTRPRALDRHAPLRHAGTGCARGPVALINASVRVGADRASPGRAPWRRAVRPPVEPRQRVPECIRAEEAREDDTLQLRVPCNVGGAVLCSRADARQLRRTSRVLPHIAQCDRGPRLNAAAQALARVEGAHVDHHVLEPLVGHMLSEHARVLRVLGGRAQGQHHGLAKLLSQPPRQVEHHQAVG